MIFSIKHSAISLIGIILTLLFLSGKVFQADLPELMKQCEEKLSKAYAADLEKSELKKVEIQLSKDGFFRYRRTFTKGKQEYFSFNFSSFEDLDYLGDTKSGFLILKTLPESIIVQTFHDPKGNIDTMANELKLPLRTIEAADLQAFQQCFLQIKTKLKP